MRIRAMGVLSTIALFATLATMAEAAPVPAPAAGPVTLAVRAGTAGHAAATRHRRVRRRRLPPPGGVYARNAILLDPTTGEVLFEKNSSRSVPIASLTKLMTAMVFLEQK